MNIQEIVKGYLIAHGYDGLFNDGGECSCELADLCPCPSDFENIAHCQPGYKVLGCPPECGMGCKFHIVAEKPAIKGG